MNPIILLYKEYTGQDPVACVPITGSGSNRQYFRLTGGDGRRLIGVVGTSQDENRAFVHLARAFAERQLPVPQVLAESADGLCYLQTDLGDRSLFDALKGGREAGGQYTERERELLRRTLALLPRIQVEGGRGLDFSLCYPQEEMDRTNVLFDLNYFKYCFLKPMGQDFHELRLEADFQQMAADLTEEQADTFLYRDFQARNVMLDDGGNPHFIDFQGGRRGPLYYDVASFLWQASARYSPALREELITAYLQALRRYREVDEAAFRCKLRLFVLFRHLQVLGAYGLRGYVERKKHFLDSIPPAVESLRALLAEGHCPYPYLGEVLTALVANPIFGAPVTGEASPSRYDGQGPLRVRVFSFSYRKGIPEDTSGNGGGYVFDCRALHNPGRYEPYKQLTGLDAPVIRFLEEDGGILTFLEAVYKLADAHVDRYLQRGFTDLMFSFGCTGGQHRSVYSAQHLAEHIHQAFQIDVEVIHREQGISQTLLAR